MIYEAPKLRFTNFQETLGKTLSPANVAYRETSFRGFKK